MKYKPMAVSREEQDLALSVADGHDEALRIVFQIKQICAIAEHTHYLIYLRWLISQNLTGKNLIHWWEVEQKARPLNAVSYIRHKVFKDPKMRPLISRIQM